MRDAVQQAQVQKVHTCVGAVRHDDAGVLSSGPNQSVAADCTVPLLYLSDVASEPLPLLLKQVYLVLDRVEALAYERVYVRKVLLDDFDVGSCHSYDSSSVCVSPGVAASHVADVGP